MSVLRIALLAAALPLALIGEENGVDHHLRISGHILPDAFTATRNGVETSGELDGFTRLRAGYLASIPINPQSDFLVGLNVVQSTISGDDGVSDIDQQGGGVEVGFSLIPEPIIAFEFALQGGMGVVDGDNIGGGHYGEFGFTFRPVLRLAMVEIFAELGHFWQKQKLDYDSGPDSDLRVNGAQFALGAGFVF